MALSKSVSRLLRILKTEMDSHLNCLVFIFCSLEMNFSDKEKDEIDVLKPNFCIKRAL